MKLGLYEFSAASKQFNPTAKIMVAHVSECNAYDFAEEVTNCALSLDYYKGVTDEFDSPCVVVNTFNSILK